MFWDLVQIFLKKVIGRIYIYSLCISSSADLRPPLKHMYIINNTHWHNVAVLETVFPKLSLLPRASQHREKKTNAPGVCI